MPTVPLSSVVAIRGGAVTSWNFGDVWRAIGAIQPSHPAIIQGDRHVSWSQFMDHSERLASYLRRGGLTSGSKVAQYLYNSPEYMVAFTGTLLNGSIPVNTNYRYEQDELIYLFDNADAEALVFHGTFTPKVEAIRSKLPKLRHLIHVNDGHGECPEWATPYEHVLDSEIGEPATLSGDDLIFLYTGGTTGMPKGVMWRSDDLWQRLNAGSFRRFDANGTPQSVAAEISANGPGYFTLPACPLMHGTGLFMAISTLSVGGTIVLLEQRHFDAAEMASAIESRGVNVAVIVGDPFARPLLRVLDAAPSSYNLASLFCIISSGAMWSEEIKAGLLAHHASMILADVFSSSEALGMGSSTSSAGAAERTARFKLGDDVRVLDDEGRDVQPGSDVIGRLMVGGLQPLGYYKDEVKTAATFQVIDGVRYSVPGDMAKVNEDGTIQLLGRGSQCINSGGEKIFPEEVEESLKTHPSVADACVVGVPDPEFGQRIVSAVELHPGQSADEAELIAHVKSQLSSYKAPRAIRIVDTIGRAVNGKMDYARHQREAAEWVLSRQ